MAELRTMEGGPADVSGDGMCVVSQLLDFDEIIIFFRFVFDPQMQRVPNRVSLTAYWQCLS
jgi:hypothetical protein